MLQPEFVRLCPILFLLRTTTKAHACLRVRVPGRGSKNARILPGQLRPLPSCCFVATPSQRPHRRLPPESGSREFGLQASRHLQASRSSFMSLNPADESASKSRSAHSLEESCILSRNLQERRASTQRAVEERAQFAELRTKSST